MYHARHAWWLTHSNVLIAVPAAAVVTVVAEAVIVIVIVVVVVFKKYKTFSVLIYSYINTSGNWKNEKLCGNTTPEGRSVFTQFRVFPIFTSVDITIYQHGKCFIFFL